MEEVGSKALADPTKSAIIAVVNLLADCVVPQLAFIAVIAPSGLATLRTLGSTWLWSAAEHAEHMTSCCSDQRMIFDFVMAEAAGIPLQTIDTLELDVPPVVGAAKRTRIFGFAIHILAEVFSFQLRGLGDISRFSIGGRKLILVRTRGLHLQTVHTDGAEFLICLGIG